VSLVLFFFIGKMVAGAPAHPSLAAYGGDYFRFVLLGVAFSGAMSTSLASLNQTIGFERGHGTLEAILLTPTPFTTVALARAGWDMAVVILQVAGYLLVGWLLFDADLSQANWAAAAPVMALTVVTFLGFGMLSAGFVMLTREASPLDFILPWASRFLAGVYFPVAVLPDWLQRLSLWLPLTHGLEALRRSLLLGAPVQAIGRELLALGAFAAVVFPAGFFFFRWAFSRARRTGSLGL
jgi:ABC-2 type transport system permease protein